MNGYFKEINEKKYLTLVPTNESKETIKKYEELWSKIFNKRDLISSVTKTSDDYDEKRRVTSKNTTEIHSIIIAVRTVFHENNKYHLLR